MIEHEKPDPEAGAASDDDISAFDAASYIYQILGEIASMAAAKQMGSLTSALNLAREIAAQAMISAQRDAQAAPPPKSAAGDAA